MPMKNARQLLLPLVLTLSLTACASKSKPTPAVQAPQIPAPPQELMEPLPSQSYSDSVRELLSTWAKKLTGSKE
jgi:hypothetical protein